MLTLIPDSSPVAADKLSSDCRPGDRADGPTLLVLTGPGLHDALSRHLSAAGRRICGTILLVRLSQEEDELGDAPIDDIVSLPQAASGAASIVEAYGTVIRKALAMGMIDRRDVAVPRVA